MADNTSITDDRARSFADALQQFEKDRDVQAFVELFADDATTERLDAKGVRHGEVAAFWEEYDAQFSHISTTFDDVVEGGDAFSLEWTSKGTLANGRSITYRGVTVVRFYGDTIAALRTYYDTAPFAVVPVDAAPID